VHSHQTRRAGGSGQAARALALRCGAAGLQADVFLPGGAAVVPCALEAPGRLARARGRAPECPLLVDLEVRGDKRRAAHSVTAA